MNRTIVIALVTVTAGLAAADRAVEPAPAPPPVQGPMGAGAPVSSMQRPPPQRPMPLVVVAPAPAPAPEIGKLGKELAGSYKCKGVSLRGDGSSSPLQATLAIKLDLDNAWIQRSLVEDAKPNGIKLVEFRTYDPIAKQWTRIQLASTSAHVVATSLGEKDGKWTWEGTASSPNGTTQVRDYEQRSGRQLKLWGEGLLSGSWQKLYEVTCQK